MDALSTLLIIDTQNDFLSLGGAFTKRPIELPYLCDAIG